MICSRVFNQCFLILELQVDKEAKFMRNKPWPLWESWKRIFGKDRASGGAAETVGVASTRLRPQPATGSQVNENDVYYPSFDDFLGSEIPPPMSPDVDTPTNNEAQSKQQVSTIKQGSNKRKASASDDALMEFLEKLHTQTNSRLDAISTRIGYEFDLGKAREQIFDKLCAVDGLTLAQRYALCNILGDKPQRLEVFKGMPDNAKLGYVLMLLDNNRQGD